MSLKKESLELAKEILLFVFKEALANQAELEKEFGKRFEGEEVVAGDLERGVFRCSRDAKEALDFLRREDYIKVIIHADMSTAIDITKKSRGILTYEELMYISSIENSEEMNDAYESIEEKIFKEVEEVGQKYLN